MSESENPVIDMPEPKGTAPRTNKDWWPNQIDLTVLHPQVPAANPLGDDFDYAAEFATLDVDALKADIVEVLNTSQEFWPADFGHYGGLMIRLSWHAAGTYRIEDGRGGAGEGQQRFAPLNSWPDNANLDKARRILWPVKQKYGQKISWADLLVLAGNVALEDMGFETFGFGFGREDVWEPEEVNWGAESEWLGDDRYTEGRELGPGLGAVQMGLIYVNPEGPNGDPDPLKAAHDIRETFRRMAMNDEETVALIAGGHSFGKTHGAGNADLVGPEPEGCPVQGMGLGWISGHGSGKGADAITSGLEVTWTSTPTRWGNGFFDNLFGNEWELEESPAGAKQWVAKDAEATIPDAFGGPNRKPTMLTTDLALRMDPAYEEISRRFHADLETFRLAFAKAWYKLLHRDMGPVTRYLGPWVAEPQLWQDPVPASTGAPSDADVADLKAKVLESGIPVADLVRTAWASAASYRNTDKRGGANGARLRLEPQRSWAVNEGAADVIATLEEIKGDSPVSLADLIVIAGNAGVEAAAKAAGHDITVPFTGGRTDASQDDTDVESFAVLEPRADGFRNYIRPDEKEAPEKLLVERAYMLGLSAPELTVLLGGLRSIGVTSGSLGTFGETGRLDASFFDALLTPGVTWTTSSTEHVYESSDGKTATANDLVFASNSVLRAIAEVYASADAKDRFVADFVRAWVKVMENDRFDV